MLPRLIWHIAEQDPLFPVVFMPVPYKSTVCIFPLQVKNANVCKCAFILWNVGTDANSQALNGSVLAKKAVLPDSSWSMASRKTHKSYCVHYHVSSVFCWGK